MKWRYGMQSVPQALSASVSNLSKCDVTPTVPRQTNNTLMNEELHRKACHLDFDIAFILHALILASITLHRKLLCNEQLYKALCSLYTSSAEVLKKKKKA